MKNRILIPIYLAFAVCLGIVIGVIFDFPQKGIRTAGNIDREQKLRQIIQFIDYEYVDSVDTDSLLDETIGSLLEKLDPHSTYIPRSEVLATEESIRGSFMGIGIEFKIYQDTLTVVRVMENGPSEKAGLKPGQRILFADSFKLFGPSANARKVVSVLKGEEGTEVDLKIFDPLREQVLEKTVRRGEVPVRSVASAFMLNDTVGMMKLVKFTKRSAREVDQNLEKLNRAGAQYLILDLRDNPGGLLTAAEEIADEFLKNDQLILYTKDRQNDRRSTFATRRGEYEEGKMAVLINGGSASASEIVAGALQDNDRALLVGRRSFGKGLVQEEITLSDGSRMRLTTQRYYTPTGRSIQKDYREYNRDFGGAHGMLPPRDLDSIKETFKTPAGRTVYGGGGIRPDLWVRFDSSNYNQLLYHLAMTVNLDDKAFSFVDANRPRLDAMSFEQFKSDFTVDSLVLNHFFGAFEIERISSRFRDELPLVKNRLKAFIAYNLFGNDAYQRIYSARDPFVQRALEGLRNELPREPERID